MFTLDIIVLNLLKRFYNVIFPWSDYTFYGFGAYAKFIIILFMLQQCFNIIYAYMEKKGGGNKWLLNCWYLEQVILYLIT